MAIYKEGDANTVKVARSVSQRLEKIREELSEVEEAIRNGQKSNIEEEIGDLYFSVINLSRFLNIDGEASLTRTNAKFIDRYKVMEELARRDGCSLDTMTLKEMDRYWERAKKSQ